MVLASETTSSSPLASCQGQGASAISERRHLWTALGPPAEALAFDFYEAMANMQPFQAHLPGRAFAEGTCNAVAFWFTLHLDEETELHTGPYAKKVLFQICFHSCSYNSLRHLAWECSCMHLSVIFSIRCLDLERAPYGT